jgi:hypothetical protein
MRQCPGLRPLTRVHMMTKVLVTVKPPTLR